MEDLKNQWPKIALGLAACGLGILAYRTMTVETETSKDLEQAKKDISTPRRHFNRQLSQLETKAQGEGLEYSMHFTEKSQYMINKFGTDANGNPQIKVDGNVDEGTKQVEWVWANKVISPWHDIPYKCSANLVSFVCEIPKFERAKMEIATKLPHNPIIQDKNKDGTPRFYHGPIFWNYGYVPQTWENPETEDKELGYKGDADPLDVVEIGMVKRQIGSVTPVKPLGILAMIDSGEVDWKMICIAEDDPLFDELDDIEDLERKCPGTISGIREWFRWYKTPDNKPQNIFGFKEEVLGVKKCWQVINHVHQDWKDLMMGKAGGGQFWTGTDEGEALNLSVSHD